ncbi:hypothetical protein Tco_0932956, partial [Tanacetum coccineum]
MKTNTPLYVWYYYETCKIMHAHVRGHQARKNYEAICWAVGIVEKIILRWHRKRVGLRGFHLDSIEDSADEDIAKATSACFKNISKPRPSKEVGETKEAQRLNLTQQL